VTAEAILPSSALLSGVMPSAVMPSAVMPTGALSGGWNLVRPDEITRAETAARLRGAAEALDLLGTRPLATRERASRYGAGLLLRHAAPADWGRSGLPLPPRPPGCAAVSVPLSDGSVLRLAMASMRLYCAGLPDDDQPWRWAQLAQFFARYLPARDPRLAELRARATRAVR
jgi:hypothetical protein